MSTDLAAMAPKSLQKLIADATRELKRKKKRAPIAQVRAKLTRQAKASGYTIKELFGDIGTPAKTVTARKTSTRHSARKVAPKYRNPNDPNQTWTGRGRAPIWFAALIEAGRTRDELLIPGA